MNPSSQQKLTVALLVLAAGVFTVRGPMRAYRYRNAWVDFAVPYVEARCWLQGLNPYDQNAHVAEWQRTGGYGLDALGGPGAAATPYFPAVLPLLAPLALLPWTAARVLWMAVSCALILLLAAGASTLRGSTGRSQKLLILALVLLAPASHTLLWTGNLTLVSVVCCLAGYHWNEQRNRPLLAGIMVALCTAAKPQIGAWVLLFYLLSRNWKLLASALATVGVLTAAFWVWLLAHGASWVRPYLAMSHHYLGPGLATDFAATNNRRFNLLNVQVILGTFFDNRDLANLLGLVLVMALLAAWGLCFAKARTQEERLLAFGTLLTLGILPVYHRIYDTILLLIPAVWTLSRFAPPWRTLVGALRILLALFLVPTGSALVAAVAANRIPPSIAGAWWWNSFIMPHQNWLLVAISIGLLLALRKLTLARARPTPENMTGRGPS
jgi:hypothetical protein